MTEESVVQQGTDLAATYIANRSFRPVQPTPDAVKDLSGFDEQLPQTSTDPAEVVAMLDRVGSPATVQTNGPRYFGFVTGGAMPVARASAALSSAWDQNGALDVMSPVAGTLDRVVVSWVQQLLELPISCTGVFCGGASEANLIGLISARDSVLRDAGWDSISNGLFGAPPVTVVVSAEAHISLTKALGLAGLGRNRVETIPTDNQGRLNTEELKSLAVESPTILCLQAGNVNTGQSDDFRAAIEWAKARGAWCHIDGAFGLWAQASPVRAHLVDGQNGADSWALDCHKWLNVPYDSALAFVADASNLRSSMAAMADYIGTGSGRAPMHLGLQMSQRARAIDTWAVLKHLGRDGIAKLVNNSCELASQFAQALADGGAEILHDVVLNQVLARFEDDATTDAVVAAVQREGTCWVGPTTWQGKRAMRISVSGYETTAHDVDLSVAAIVRCWRRVSAQH